MSADIRTSFEKQLKIKLTQKSTSFSSEEQILNKNFRFFDLNNNGQVEFDEFCKALEKTGIQYFTKDQLKDLFDYYDHSGDGALDYKEFTSMLFGQPQASKRYEKKDQITVDTLLTKVRTALGRRGPGGILGLGKQFRIADKNRSQTLDKEECVYALRDFGTGVNAEEAELLFEHFDKDRSGEINYDEFLLSIRGKMNNFRQKLVNQAFDIIDKDKSGELTIDDLRGTYNAREHPEVKAGKKTEDQVLHGFLKTFESMYDYNRVDDDKVTREEFTEYYNYVSASIDDDRYFELLMNNTWRMNDGANRNWNKKGWKNKYDDRFESPPRTSAVRQNQRDEVQNHEDEKVDFYEKQSRRPRKGAPQGVNLTLIMEKVRNRLKLRGAKAYIGLQRQFRIMDDNDDKELSYAEFHKGMQDFKIELTDNECRALFIEFDMDNSGKISIDEFVRGVRGPMNSFRTNLVKTAFNILDKNSDGVLQINDIKGVYNAKNHPDVKSGKRTEDDILGEFLETFETHHNLRTGYKDQTVTQEEFVEYYTNISANIDNDKYFELMMINSYKLYNYDSKYKDYAPAGGSPQKGWQGNYGKVKKDSRYSPFGVSEEPTDYSTNLRPQTSQGFGKATSGFNRGSPIKHGDDYDDEHLMEFFRKKVHARGARGILGLSKNFRIIDDDNSQSLDIQEFSKCCKDFRLDFKEDHVKRVFKLFDTNRDGTIDYNEFLRAIRGPMPNSRVKLVKQAFVKLDLNNNGTLELDDIRTKYNAKNHPDVRAGKKSEEQILCEFLDTFEQHHATMTGDYQFRDAKVTFDEFKEYYNNISSSIDDDRYFELMMTNTWNFEDKTFKKGWAGKY